jgi:hypothetical protein
VGWRCLREGYAAVSAVERDIRALRVRWGGEYEINWDFQAQVFRAVKGASVLEHRDPAELWKLIAADDASRAPAAEP